MSVSAASAEPQLPAPLWVLNVEFVTESSDNHLQTRRSTQVKEKEGDNTKTEGKKNKTEQFWEPRRTVKVCD